MNKALLFRLHRWITLTFSLPLAVIIVTGAILSFEPIATGGGGPHAITVDALERTLATHDASGTARMLVVRAYDGTVSVGGARGAMIHVDVGSNRQIAAPGALAALFGTARRLHETLVWDQRWLVTVSTAAMLALIALGILMGWPRMRNSMAGWHKGTAWILLPLVILSPLSGLLLALGITLSDAPPAAASDPQPPSLAEAIRIVAQSHDLSAVNWIRERGNTVLARIDDGGEMRVFSVARDGLHAMARNWPRLIHEGNWSGVPSALVNVVTSAALLLLFVTGVSLWGRRGLRRWRGR